MRKFLRVTVVLLLGTLLLRSMHAAEESAVVNESKINVRGQPSLIGEVITQLQKGDEVTVLDRVVNERAKGGEPSNWAKIKLPANTPVWVYAELVKNGAVSATRLNLRAGPGDNYSVIGRLNKGDKVNPIRTMGDWIEIEAPAGTYAFVDANLLKFPAGSSPVPGATTAVVATTETAKTTPDPAQPEPVSPPANTNTVAATTAPAEPPPAVPDALAPVQAQRSVETTVVVKPQPASAFGVTSATELRQMTHEPAPAPLERTLEKVEARAIVAAPPAATVVAAAPAMAPDRQRRVVRREGIVRATVSIQAPTWYELVHPQTRKTIDYLHAEKAGLKLKQYRGQKVIVSGEEGVDPRWPNTPILELETLDIAP